MVRGLAERFPDYGVEGEVYVTAPGAEIEEGHELVAAIDGAHEEVFGEPPGRDVTRWFSDASALTRYGVPTVNYGTSTGLMDVELGENLEIDSLVRTAEVYARVAMGVSGVGTWQACVVHKHEAGSALEGERVKLVTFGEGEGRVGVLDGEEIAVLDVPTMRDWFERGGADETGERVALADTRLRAPIVPKKFFHTAGNFREHDEESKNVNWSHVIAPWINFFQNVDAIVGPDEPVIYPEHLTEELDYELELAVVLKKPGKWFTPEEAMDYVGGYVIFNDITARDIQRGEMKSGVFSFCKAIDTFCPLGPWIVTPDEIADPHDLAMQLRVNGEVRQESHSEPHVGDDPRDPLELLGAHVLGRRRPFDRDGLRRCRVQVARGACAPVSEARRRDRGRDRGHRRPPQSRDLLAGRARHAAAAAGAALG